jgi:hypothetical protein
MSKTRVGSARGFKPLSIESVEKRDAQLAGRLRAIERPVESIIRDDPPGDGLVQRSEFRQLSHEEKQRYQAIAEDVPASETEAARAAQRQLDLRKAAALGAATLFVAAHFTPAAPVVLVADALALGAAGWALSFQALVGRV